MNNRVRCFALVVFMALVALVAIGCDKPRPPSAENLRGWVNEAKAEVADTTLRSGAGIACDFLARHDSLCVSYGIISKDTLDQFLRLLSLKEAAWQLRVMHNPRLAPGPTGSPYEVAEACQRAVDYGNTTTDIVATTGINPEALAVAMQAVASRHQLAEVSYVPAQDFLYFMREAEKVANAAASNPAPTAETTTLGDM